MSEKLPEKEPELNIKNELNKLLALIHSNKWFLWKENAKIGVITPDSCSRYVRTVLYNKLWEIKWIVGKNKLNLIWDTKDLFNNSKKQAHIVSEQILTQTHADWIYDIVISEYKQKNNRHVYHRLFIASQNWKMYTIDPFYDSNNSEDSNLNNTEILEIKEWLQYFSEKNKKNAEFKILAQYDLSIVNIRE